MVSLKTWIFEFNRQFAQYESIQFSLLKDTELGKNMHSLLQKKQVSFRKVNLTFQRLSNSGRYTVFRWHNTVKLFLIQRFKYGEFPSQDKLFDRQFYVQIRAY